MVAAGRSSKALGARIASKLGVQLTDAGLKTFSDGEVYCRYEESIRGADVFIVQSIAGNDRRGRERQRRADGAARDDRGGRRRLGAPGDRGRRPGTATRARTRSRRRASRSPRGWSRACSRRPGIDRLLTMDLHAGQVQGFFSNPVDHMTAMPILTQFVKDQLGDPSKLVIISPDAGRVKLTRKFAQKIGAPVRAAREGAARPAGRRDRLRDRRRQGEGRGDRRRHHRHRRDARGRRADRARRGRVRGLRGAPRTGSSPATRSRRWTGSPLSGIVVTDTVPLRDGRARRRSAS